MGKINLLILILMSGVFMTSLEAVDQSTADGDTSSNSMAPTIPSTRNGVSKQSTSGAASYGSTSTKDDTPATSSSKKEEEPEPQPEPEPEPEPEPSGETGDVSSHDGNGDRQPLTPPVWSQCLSDVTSEDLSEADVIAVFTVWCRNYDAIIECLSRDLPGSAFSNPFDFFIYLNFEPGRLMNRSKEFCGKFEAVTDDLTCASTQNETLSAACGHGFARGLFHIFDIFNHRDVPEGVLEEIACDVTTQTTLCLKQTLPDCKEEVITPALYYYALFTNDTCVAQPGQTYPTPQLPPKRPETIVTKCANEAAQSLTPDQSAAQPTSLVDFVILGLKADCKSYETRYTCYHRELRNITNFMDFWLSMTFDFKNAMTSQEAYCAEIEDSIIPYLNNECFNKSQPGLAECEAGFSREVDTIRQELAGHPDIDEVELQTIACRTSVTRAVCLGHAMNHCGDEVAQAMSISEMGILPDICRQLLAPRDAPASDDNDPETDSHQGGHGDDSSVYGVKSGPRSNHKGPDHGIRESNGRVGNYDNVKPGQQGEMDKKEGTSLSASKSRTGDANKSDDGDTGDGVGIVRVNVITLSVVAALVMFFVLNR